MPERNGMKLLFSIAISTLLTVLLVSVAEAGQVSVTYRFGNPRMEKTDNGFSRIYFPSTVQAGRAGGPSFPFRGAQILLPPGERVSGLTIRRRGWKKIEKNIRLHPRQHPTPGINRDNMDNRLLYDSAVYESNEWIHPPVSEFSTHYYRGHSIAVGNFTPVGFRPAAEETGYYSEIEITIETTSGDGGSLWTAPGNRGPRALDLLRTDAATKKYLKDIVDNPDLISLYNGLGPEPPSAEGDYEYMIITRADFEDDFGPLRDFYTRRGMRTRIMTFEHIESTYPGNDSPERIRNAIIGEYTDNGITHVLLGGDGDSGSLVGIPFRGLYCGVQSSSWYEDSGIPADLYFAALDGSWNTDSDALWGEPGEEDFYSEVSIGRASVDSPEKIATFINKTTMYQESPVSLQLRNALMLGEHLWSDPLTYGGDEMDQLIDTCSAYGFFTKGMDSGFNITKYYDRDLGSWAKSVIYDEVNAGTNWLNHAGHSNSSYVMRLPIGDVNETNFTNDGITANFSIVYTYGCIAGAFDMDDCIGEKIVNIGTFACAFIGNSRYGWFTEGTTNGPSHHFQREFFDAAFTEGYTNLGTANQRSKDETAPFVDLPDEYEPGAHRWCFYTLNLLGDPALDGWTDTPSAMPVSHSPSIARDETIFSVSTGTEGALAALYWNGTCFGRSIAVATGNISMTLLESIPGDVDSLVLSVTAHNRYLYRDTLVVNETTGSETPPPPLAILEQNRPNPFNPSTVICFSLGDDSSVDLRVYDIAGREVDKLISRRMEAGSYSIEWQPAGLSSGVYFYVLKAGETRISRKAVLLR